MSSRKKEVGVDMGLKDEEKADLLNLVKSVVESKSKGEKAPRYSPSSETLKEKRGAFVTIHKNGMLRGCIGWLEATKPLYETVEEMAEAAAFRDPRFRPIASDELEMLDYEISVLTPFQRVQDVNEIQVGIHGILIRNGTRSGLLLPQVATERNWDRNTFLEETCRKAGLARDTWKDPSTEIYVFSADVF
ncbi:MAG: AmmeMemoRadiSam system protein A [Deltaproteobacteria bacterium]|nr:AmmeMemoRadiSam system protein A [Deltaproteobacteria bacterium]